MSLAYQNSSHKAYNWIRYGDFSENLFCFDKPDEVHGLKQEYAQLNQAVFADWKKVLYRYLLTIVRLMQHKDIA